MAVCSPQPTLVGRDDELDLLSRLLGEVMGGAGRSVWIEGEPGIGKSALLESFLAEAARRGCAVRSATAEEFGHRVPLHVMLECLGATPGSADPGLRDVAELLSCGAHGDPVTAAAERLLGHVDRLTADGPLVLAVDDLQWADEFSVPLLHRLSRLALRRPLLLVCVCRPAPRRPDLVTLRRGLTASDAEMLRLSALTPAAVATLAAGLAAALTVRPEKRPSISPALRETAEQAAGNPSYLRELLAALAREDRLRWDGDTVDVDSAEPPRTLADAVTDRLAFLSPGALELLRTAALLGRAFSVTCLEAVVGRSALELTAALEEATATGVLAESELLLAFRHPMVRQALYERPPAGLRLALHLQAARALADAGLAVEHVAEQLLAALRTSEHVPVGGWAVDWLLVAGRTLVGRAPRDAAELLGLAVAGLPADDPRRESLEAILATALVLLGRRDEAVRLAEKVAAATRDSVRAAEMSWTAAWAMTDDDRHEAALAVLGRALRAPGLSPAWSARLHAMLARAAIADGDLGRARAAARQALDEAARSGDRPAAAAAEHAAGLLLGHRGEPSEAAARFEHGLAVAELCDDPETQDLRLRLRQDRAYALLAQERHADADLAAGELLAAAERTAAPPRLACARILAADVHYHAGRWDDAVAQLDAAAASDDLIPAGDRRWLHGLAAVIAVHRDDQASAESHLGAVPAGETFAGTAYVPLARALLAERRDLTGEALAVLTGLLDRAGTVYHRHIWLPVLLRLALRDGDDALARAARVAAGEPAAAGTPAVSRTAVARHCAGLIESDAEALGAAVAAYRAMGRPLQLAQTLEDTAVVLAERGDLRAARTAHSEATELYTGLGARWDLLRADTRLRRHGVQRRRGPRRRAATGWEALTPAELTVARLVADGRPNPDIAASLFVSRRTVEVHVSHILSKLGVRSRVEIAREAAGRLELPSAV
ncbi:helix-turn-helix transcriptional regulator [Actinoallomurus iriomotensis]|uniref:SARP family transcriptional regulator n=1 Tax=Actinoallomurus iriomotensis TaxID=478107 RepID=A0A9W6VX65_9ACTN|nr:LuxR family transcriptional regulator [Actinoallomurus iriomotensis]GLY83540.1 SARP family transcriptional regulator [Actinoallomurus iriomotensis]